MTEKGIEEIFKSAFDHFESDVDPNVWTNVQSHISGTPAAQPSHGANSSIAGKAGAVAGKLGVKAIVTIIAAMTGVGVGTYLLLPEMQNKKFVPATVQSSQQAVQVAPTQQAIITHEQSASTAAPQVNKIAPEQKMQEEKKQVAASPIITAEPQQSSAMPAKNNTAGNPPAAVQAASLKTAPVAGMQPPAVTKNSDPKPAEETAPTVNHTYQNDFADINDYLETESSSAVQALPNVFSPNGDGKNDVFTIKTKNLKSLTVTVFDQSGKLIYQWNSLDGGWDGNLSDGRPAPIGNYYYSLLAETVDGKKCIANSSLSLVR